LGAATRQPQASLRMPRRSLGEGLDQRCQSHTRIETPHREEQEFGRTEVPPGAGCWAVGGRGELGEIGATGHDLDWGFHPGMPYGKAPLGVLGCNKDPGCCAECASLGAVELAADPGVQEAADEPAGLGLLAEGVLESPGALKHEDRRPATGRGLEVGLMGSQQRWRMAGRKEFVEDLTGCCILRTPIREERTGTVGNAMEFDAPSGFLGWKRVSGVREDGVNLVAAPCQPFGDFGRIAVPTAIEIRMVAQREEDKAHFLRPGCYLRGRAGSNPLLRVLHPTFGGKGAEGHRNRFPQG